MTACSLTISIKFLVAGCGVVQSNLDPTVVGNDSIMSATSFYGLSRWSANGIEH